MEAFVQTGNLGLASQVIRSGGYNSPVVTILLDTAMEDHEWAVFEGDQMAAGPYSIGNQVAYDIRAKLAELGAIPAPPPKRVEEPEVIPARKVVKEITLDTCTENLIGLQKRTAKNFLEMGKWLTEAKRLIGHGNWLGYLETVDFKEWQAQSLMGMYREWGSNPKLIEDLKWTQLVEILRAPREIHAELIEFAPGHTIKEIQAESKSLRRGEAEIQLEPAIIAEPAPPPESPVETVEDPAEPKSLPPTPPQELPSEPAEDAGTGMVSEAPERTAETAEEITQPAPAEVPSPPKEPALPPPPAPKKKAPEIEILPPLPDPQKRLKDEAYRVDRAVGVLYEAVKKQRSVLEGASSKDIGEWVDVKALSALRTELQGLGGLLKTLEANYTRQWEELCRRKAGADGNQ